MGRVSKIPEIEARIGQPLGKYLLDLVKQDKKPPEIASILGVSLSNIYKIIEELGLKSKIKEITHRTEGMSGELAEMFQKFLASSTVKGKSAKTLTSYEGTFKNFLWWLDDKGIKTTLKAWNPDNIRDFMLYMGTTTMRYNSINPALKKVAGQNTLLSTWNKFHAVGEWARSYGGILPRESENPVQKDFKPKKPKAIIMDMPDDEILTLLRSFGNDFIGIRDKTIIILFLDSGMRLGGMSSLQIGTFDLAREGWGVIKEKGEKERRIQLSTTAITQLKTYLEARNQINPEAKALWINSTGNMLTKKGIEVMLGRLDKQGIVQTHLHAHLFRHVWAKHMVLSKVSALALMKMAGWEDLELAQHYTLAYSDKDAWSEHENASPITKLLGVQA